nr:hypothetical protein [Moraxella sp. CTOTU48717]
MIQINQIWLSTTAMDMRSGSNKLLAFILEKHHGIKRKHPTIPSTTILKNTR